MVHYLKNRIIPVVWLAIAITLSTASGAFSGFIPPGAPSPPTDGYLDDVYKEYGTVIRYSDTNIHAPTGESNVASAYMYVLEDENNIYVYYHQDMYYQNDTSYGANMVHWESINGARSLYDIWESDNGEFKFVDAGGAVAAWFHTDQIEPGQSTPSRYDCLGFSGGEGGWIGGPIANQQYITISSSMDWNLNYTGYCSNGACNCGGVNLLNTSPSATDAYETINPACDDWVWYNGWEIKVEKAAFDAVGDLGFGVVIGSHHNSPTKMCQKHNRCAADMYVAISDIGDRVWYDLDGDGLQDVGEPGLTGVTVNLIDPRDGSVIESQKTGANGKYLFMMLSNQEYIVQVDESSLPPGFASTMVNNAPADFYTSYFNNDATCLYANGCIQRDNRTYTRAYAIDLDEGESYRAADFGYLPSGAAIGDFVWSDADNDGFQDPGEPGIGGVLLELLDGVGSPIMVGGTPVTTTTSSSGWYLFAGLDAGTYIIRVAASNFNPGAVLDGYALTFGAQSSDNPTLPIDLLEDRQILYADFGFYKAGLGMIGNYVWFDSDNDGVQDGDEGGAADVTLDLYIDVNGNAVIDSGDSYIAQTVTGSNGIYLFAGVPLGTAPDGIDYLVTVTDRNGILDGFYITSYDFTLNRYNDPYPLTLSPSQASVMTADFGFNRNYVIGDTVWLDADQDGYFDPNERGVGGVTVTLRMGTTIVATTTTDQNGRYLFTNLATGTYGVTITVPSGYYMSCNTGALGCASTYWWTLNPHNNIVLAGRESYLAADFALYKLTYSLGDRVWFDEDGDGIQDAAEAGIPNISLSLYEDQDNDGMIDPTEPEIARIITDASGNYLFIGLDNNKRYIVEVVDILGVLTGYTLTTANQPYAHLMNGNYLAADFGYQAPPTPTLAMLSQLTAYDDDRERVIEWITASEIGTAGFLIFRRDTATDDFVSITPVRLPSRMESGIGGKYRFIDRTVLKGDAPVYRLVEVEARGGRRVLGETGLAIQAAAPLSIVEAPGEVAAELAPVTETFFRSPRVAGRKQSEQSVPLSSDAVETPSVSGRTLMSFDSSPAMADRVRVDVTGEGLFEIRAAEIAAATGMTGETISEAIAGRQVRVTNRGNTVAWLPFEDNTGFYFHGEKIESPFTDVNVYWIQFSPSDDPRGDVDGDGRVDATDLIICLNVLSGNSAPGIRPVYPVSGADVNGNGLIDLSEVVYINDSIRRGGSSGSTGIIMEIVSGDPPGLEAADQTFTDTMLAEQDVWPMTDYYFDPEEDFWLWNLIDYAYQNPVDFTISIPGVASGSHTAKMTVHLKGLYDGPSIPDHHAIIHVNGQWVGEMEWDGFNAVSNTFTFDQSLLVEGNNTIRVETILNEGVDDSKIGVDSFDVTWQRSYRAEGDMLVFNSAEHVRITVTGFTGDDVSLFDVSSPLHPKQVSHIRVEAAGGFHQVTFEPEGPGRTYLAVRMGMAKSPDALVAYAPAGLADNTRAGDYLVITSGELAAGAQTLADYRETRGYTPAVVTVDAIFNEFSAGIYDPNAIRTFVGHAVKHWSKPPRFVVLVGDGTYDYRNIQMVGDNIVPVMMAGTPYGLFGSDIFYVDIDNDGGPDLPIGRIPVTTEGELQAVIDKIMAHEAGLTSARKDVIMVADYPDTDAGDFPADSNAVAALIPPDYTAVHLNLSDYAMVADARTALMARINPPLGASVVNYIGHGGYDVLSKYPGMLTSSHGGLFVNNQQQPLFVALTCLVGGFFHPRVDSFSETMVLQPDSGFVAAWSPTGPSINEDAVRLNRELFKSIFADHAPTLGDAVLQALRTYHADNHWPFMIHIYDILGDPALALQPEAGGAL